MHHFIFFFWKKKSKNRSKEAKIAATSSFVGVRKFFSLLVLRFSVLNLSLEEVLSWNLDVKALVCCPTKGKMFFNLHPNFCQ